MNNFSQQSYYELSSTVYYTNLSALTPTIILLLQRSLRLKVSDELNYCQVSCDDLKPVYSSFFK